MERVAGLNLVLGSAVADGYRYILFYLFAWDKSTPTILFVRFFN